jgi:hypothetical protein
VVREGHGAAPSGAADRFHKTDLKNAIVLRNALTVAWPTARLDPVSLRSKRVTEPILARDEE